MVGHRFVQAGIERGLTETHDIVVLGEEPRAAITGSLTSVFADDGADELSLLPEGKYADPRVRLVLGAAVTASERPDRAVTGDDSVAVLRLRPAGTERVTEPL